MLIKSNHQLKKVAQQVLSGELKNNPSIGNSLFVTISLDKIQTDKKRVESISIHLRYTSCLSGQRTSMLIGKSNIYDSTGISVEDAILESIRLKKLNKSGVDPKQQRQKERDEIINQSKDPKTLFEYFARAYLEKNKPVLLTNGEQAKNTLGQPIGWSKKHYEGQKGRLESHILPEFNKKQINEITKGDLVRYCLDCLISGEHSWSTVEKLITILNGTFEEASLDIPLVNPATNLRKHIRNDLKAERPHPNINPFKKPSEFGRVIADMYQYTDAIASTLLALRLAPHLFLRTENLVSLRWNLVSFEERQITIPKEYTKNKKVSYAPDLVVPLSDQALEILKQAFHFYSKSEYVFPSNNTKKHITDNCLRKNYNALGYRDKQCIHGFRHSAKTWLKEKGFSTEATELQLHHVRSKIEETYDGSELISERTKMMQAWSDFLYQQTQTRIDVE